MISARFHSVPEHGGVLIALANGGQTRVDLSASVGIALHTWYRTKSPTKPYAYRRVTINGRRQWLFLHRWLTHCPPWLVVHHINGDTLDNRRANLVLLTKPAHDNLRKTPRLRRAADGGPTKQYTPAPRCMSPTINPPHRHHSSLTY